jgi:hypothetical protein
LKSIGIPGNVTCIDGSASAWVSLNSIWVSPDNMRFQLRDCFLEDVGGPTIYWYFGSCHSIVIPSWVSVLGQGVFMSASHLNPCHLKVLLDWNGSNNLHFVGAD